uniref:Dermaseptin-1.2TR n=1 Tax=Phyllomedusa trinitatis TaxID=332092 RepID=DRS12_PHYTB|nr:RecName: Full=Dermaseptin-1.2TR [Phyllomedusa trinitatis]
GLWSKIKETGKEAAKAAGKAALDKIAEAV